jgi:6-phosphogluconolactonase (cycloisomerase 2 family)
MKHPKPHRSNRRSRSRRLFQFELLESRRVLDGDQPPNVLAISRLDANPTNQAQVAYQVLFDEAIQASTVDVADFALTRTGTIAGQSVSLVVSSAGTGVNSDTFVVLVNTGSGDGTLRLDVIDNNTIRDLSGDRLGGNGPNNGNFTLGQFYTLDKTPPIVVTLNRVQATPNAAVTVQYALQFSENVQGVDASDFDLIASGPVGASVTGISGSGSSYTVTVGTGIGDGTLQLRLADNDSISDMVSNALGGIGVGNGTFLGQIYVIDRPPLISTISTTGNSLTNATSVTFAVHFNEPVTGVDPADFAPQASSGIAGASISGVSGSGSDWFVTTHSGTGDGALGLSVVSNTIFDSSGQSLTLPAPTSQAFSIDKTVPTVTTRTPLDFTYTNAATVRFGFEFSEPIVGLDISDFEVSNFGSVSGGFLVSVSGSGSSYVVTGNTGTGSGGYSIRLATVAAFFDAAGNQGSTSTPGGAIYTIDRVAPAVVSVVPLDPSPTNLSQVRYEITFSEPVTGVGLNDFAVVTGLSGAAIATVTSIDNVNFRVVVNTGTGDGNLSINVLAANQILDLAGNALPAAVTNNPAYLVDKTAPALNLVSRLDPSPTAAATVSYGLQFSEAVTGVALSSFNAVAAGLVGSNVVSLSGSGASYTVVLATGSGAGTLRLGYNLNVQDAVGNPSRINDVSGTAYTVDRQFPVVSSITPVTAGPTASSDIFFNVSFSEAVNNVTTADFAIETTGVSGASVFQVTSLGNGNFSVRVLTGSGDGTIKLKVVDDDSVVDALGNPLGGVGAGNGDFTSPTGTSIKKSVDFAGVVWDDGNADGYLDPGETPLAGVTVFIDANGNGIWDSATETSQTTDSQGAYRFVNLPSGTYTVGVVSLSGLQQTFPASGGPGRLTLRDVEIGTGTPTLDGPRAVAITPNGQFVYVGGVNSSSIHAYQLNAGSGQLQHVQTVSGYAGLYQLTVSSDGKNLYAVSASTNQVSVFGIGSTNGLLTLVDTETQGVGGVTGMNFAHGVDVSPDGAFVYVSGDGIATFARNGTSGALSYVGATTALANAFSVKVSPDGAYLYATETAGNLRVFVRNANGTLTLLQALADGQNGGNDLLFARSVTTSPNGSHIYVAASTDNSVSVFSRQANGTLAFVQSVRDGLDGHDGLQSAHDVKVSPDGKRVYVAGELDAAMTVLQRDLTTGQLSRFEEFRESPSTTYTTLSRPNQMAVSSDGRFVVLTALDDDAVNLFENGYGTPVPRLHVQALPAGTVRPRVDFGLTNLAPVALSMSPVGQNPTAQSTATFTVQFSEPVSGVDVSDFSLLTNGLSGSSIASVSGSNTAYTVTVNTGEGSGNLTLVLNDNDSIVDVSGRPLGGVGAASSVLSSNPLLLIDRVPPTVNTISALDPLFTRSNSVRYQVAFSELVTGVDVTDFATNVIGSLSGVSITSVSGSGASYVFTVTATSGSGTVALRLVDDDSIVDIVGIPLAGAGVGNGNQTSPDSYTIELAPQSSISGVKWNDLNKNGLLDSGEPGLPGWTVYVDSNQNGLRDAGEPGASTAANGSYTIGGLFSGNYVVREVPQVGWTQTAPNMQFPIKRVSERLDSFSDSYSLNGDLSGDGRFVTFSSASPLVPAKTNGVYDIFVRDLQSGVIDKITNGLSGAQPNNSSYVPVISDDGRYVAFVSSASNLVANDTNGFADAFVFDRQTRVTTRVSVGAAGIQANAAVDITEIAISGNGQFIAFRSSASNLVVGDTNAFNDVFVHDRLSGVTERISIATDGTQANGSSNAPSLSFDGRMVAFQSSATNLVANDSNARSDIFVRDRVAGATSRVSVSESGSQALASSLAPSISGDGTSVVFVSTSNLTSATVHSSVFVRDLVRNTTTNVGPPTIQAFDTLGIPPERRPAISFDGRYVVMVEVRTNPDGFDEIVIVDRATQNWQVISRSQQFLSADGDSSRPSISNSGSSIVFTSQAGRLLPQDTNGRLDVFQVDIAADFIQPTPSTRGARFVSLGVSASMDAVHFGNVVTTGSVAGELWKDTNRDGLQATSEPVIANRTVYIDANQNRVLDAGEVLTVSDPVGRYRLSDVPAGNYRVHQVLPANWTEHAPGQGFSLNVGVSSQRLVDFEEIQPPVTGAFCYLTYFTHGFAFGTFPTTGTQWCVSGAEPSKFLSAQVGADTQFVRRADNLPFDLESLSLHISSGIVTGTVAMIGEKSDGSVVTQNVNVTSTPTSYPVQGFTDVVRVRWVELSGHRLGVDNVSLRSATWDHTRADFGSMENPGNLSGRVFADTNQNGLQDGAEQPLAGWSVFIDANNNGQFDNGEIAVNTNASGDYLFPSAEPGSLVVRARDRIHWSEVAPGNGHPVTLPAGGSIANLNFALFAPPTSISGVKWHDLDRDGVRDAGEPGLPGTVVYIDLNGNHQPDNGEPSTTTVGDNPGTPNIDETGSYAFTNVAPGAYDIREVANSGWTQTSPTKAAPSLAFLSANGYDYSGYVHHDNWDQATNADGSIVTFSSTAKLLATDTNNNNDIYALDRSTNQLELITANPISVGNSFEPDISDDGRYVAFRSFANFDVRDSNNATDIYVYDRVTRTFELATPSVTNGSSNNYSYEPKLTANGRRVTFFSWASNLVSTPSNGNAQFYVRNLDTGVTTRVNSNSDAMNTWGGEPSADGSRIVFQSLSTTLVANDTNNLSDIFVLDTSTGQTTRASTASDGTQANAESDKRAISGNGRWVAFDSKATNLTDDIYNGSYNVFLKDLVTGDTRLITRNYLGTPGSGQRPEISYDGRWISFESTSQNMFPDSANSYSSIYLYDRLTDQLVRLTQDSYGTKSSGASTNANISRDGSSIVFDTQALNLTGSRGLVVASNKRLLNQPLANYVELVAGQQMGGVDFGNAQTSASISGFAFRDINANGVQDSGEAGYIGITVYLDLNDNGRLDLGEPNQITDGSGGYSFTSLAAGDYAVRQVMQSTFEQIAPISSGRTRLFNYNFTNLYELDSANGRVLNTFSPPAVGDGLAFVENALYLLDKATRRIYYLDPLDGTVVDSMNLPTGAYDGLAALGGKLYVLDSTVDQVLVVNPQLKQISQTLTLQGATAPLNVWGALGESGDGQYLTVATATTVYYVSPTTGMAVSSFLHGIDFTRTSATITSLAGANGELFLMGGLSDSLLVYNNAGTLSRTVATGPRQSTSLAAGSVFDRANRVTLAWDGNVSGVQFASRPHLGSISGRLFNDVNSNGTQDSGENGLPNVSVYVDSNGNSVLDSGEPRATTNSDGDYSFSNLSPGSFIVRSVVPAGQLQASPAVASKRLFGVFRSPTTATQTGFYAGIDELNPNTGGTLSSFVTTIPIDAFIGAAFDGTNILLLSRYNQKLYEISPAGVIVDQSPISSTVLPGLAYVDGLAYYVDSIGAWPNLIAFDPKTNQIVRQVAITHRLDGYGAANFPVLGVGMGESPDGHHLVLTSADGAGNDRRLLLVDPFTGRITDYFTPDASLPDDHAATSVGGELFVSTTGNNVRVFGASFNQLRSMTTTNLHFGLAGGLTYEYGYPVTLQSQQQTTNINIGLREFNSSIKGHLYEDRNANAVQDANEPNQSGVRIYLDTNLNHRFDSGEPTALTDGSGNYLITNVAPGGYTIRLVPSAGMDVITPSRQSLRVFATRVDESGVGKILELDPLAGGILNQFDPPVGTTISPATGLAFDGTRLFFVESNTDRLITLNPENGALIRSMQLASGAYDGLAAVAGRLYVSEVVNNTILEIEPVSGALLRTLDINAINPSYLGVGTTIDLLGSLAESPDGARIIASATSPAATYVINPATGVIEGTFSNAPSLASAAAAGEFLIASGSTLVSYSAQAGVLRRTAAVDRIYGLAAASRNDRGQRLVLTPGQDSFGVNFAQQDNSTPTNLAISSNEIREYLPINSVVGEFSASDANTNDLLGFQLVAGTGDVDNASFRIVGNQLQTSSVFNHSIKSSYSIRVRVVDATGNSSERSLAISVLNLPELAAPVRIGDGTTQRSMVNQLVIEFDGPVDIDAGAFEVQKREQDTNGNLVLQSVTVNTPITEALANGHTRVTLTFSGALTRPNVLGAVPNALVDGNYQLLISASKIRTAGRAVEFDGDRNGQAGGNFILGTQAIDKFFAYYGDINGDRTLNLIDYTAFRNAYGKTSASSDYRIELDYNLDGIINLPDYTQFRNRYGKIQLFF